MDETETVEGVEFGGVEGQGMLEGYRDLLEVVMLPEGGVEGLDFGVVFKPSFHRESAIWIADGKAGVSWAGSNIWQSPDPVEITRVVFDPSEADGELPPYGLVESLASGIEDAGGIVMDGMAVEVVLDGDVVWDDSWVKITDDKVRWGIDLVLQRMASACGVGRAVSALGDARQYMHNQKMVVDWVECEGGVVAVPTGSALDYGNAGRPEVTDEAIQVGAEIRARQPSAVDVRAMRIQDVRDVPAWGAALGETGTVICEGGQEGALREMLDDSYDVEVLESLADVTDEGVGDGA